MTRALHLFISVLGSVMLCHVAAAQHPDIVWLRGGHEAGIRAVAATSDGTQLYSASADSTIRLWNPANGMFTRVFDRQAEAITSLALSPDENYLASGGAGGVVKVWHLPTGALVHSLDAGALPVLRVAFSQDGAFLFYGLDDGAVRSIHLETGGAGDSLPALHQEFIRMEINGVAGYVATSNWLGDAIRIRRAGSPDVLDIPVARVAIKAAFAFSGDGRLLAYNDITDTGTRRIRIVSAGSGEHRGEMILGRWEPERIMFEGNSELVVAASHEDSLMVESWKFDGGIPAGTRYMLREKGFPVTVDALMFQPGTRRLILGGYHVRYYGGMPVFNEFPVLESWDLSSANLHADFIAHRGPVASLAIIDEAHVVVSGATDPELKLWNIATGALADTRHYHKPMLSMALAPDGATVLLNISNSENVGEDGTWLYDVPIRRDSLFLGWFPNVVSNGPDFIAQVTPHQQVVIYYSASGDTIRLGPAAGNRYGATSYDGRFLAWHNDDGRIRVADQKMRAVTNSIESFPAATALAISREGGTVALAGADNTIGVWRRENGLRLATLHGHTGKVNALAFSPDERFLVSASDDGTVRIWKIATEENIYTYTPYQVPLVSLSVSADALFIAAGRADGGVMLLHARDEIASVERRTDIAAGLVVTPNPAAGSASISFRLDRPGPATLSLHSSTGQEITTLLRAYLEAGEQHLSCDVSGLPAGVYFVRLQTSGSPRTQPIVIRN